MTLDEQLEVLDVARVYLSCWFWSVAASVFNSEPCKPYHPATTSKLKRGSEQPCPFGLHRCDQGRGHKSSSVVLVLTSCHSENCDPSIFGPHSCNDRVGPLRSLVRQFPWFSSPIRADAVHSLVRLFAILESAHEDRMSGRHVEYSTAVAAYDSIKARQEELLQWFEDFKPEEAGFPFGNASDGAGFRSALLHLSFVFLSSYKLTDLGCCPIHCQRALSASPPQRREVIKAGVDHALLLLDLALPALGYNSEALPWLALGGVRMACQLLTGGMLLLYSLRMSF